MIDFDPVLFVILTTTGGVILGAVGGWLAGTLILWLIRREN
jgi:hypothetical protein